MIVCWSVKGGSGTTIVASLLALSLARRDQAAARGSSVAHRRSTWLLDASGDVAAAMAIRDDRPGVAQWLHADGDAPVSGLDRLAIELEGGLRVVPWGSAPHPNDEDARFEGALTEQVRRLAEVADGRRTVVDAGTLEKDRGSPGQRFLDHATSTLLVLRPCYLALDRVRRYRRPVDGCVMVDEPGRSLRADDVADVVGAPVLATVPWDPAIARAVDAGRLATRRVRGAKSIDRLAARLDVRTDHPRAN